MAKKLTAGLLAMGAVAALATWYAMQRIPSPPLLSFTGFPAFPVEDSRFTGTATCSGRACHGSLEPSGERAGIQGNEHTTWLTNDRHADAYRVLFNERSGRIARALDLKNPAHENERCLVCHANPELGRDDSGQAQAERQAGVGCETCHSAARDWLAPHTGWAALDKEQKQEQFTKHGMTWLAGPRERAETCVRCHVGVGEGDVDHDLIAAGHPRLEFELTAFLANMPPHWRERDAQSGHEARAWAVGQIVTARAALRLTGQRATGKSWPEFAEYDCFACHHDLSDQRWRRDRNHLGARPPGSPPWNERYLKFLPELSGMDAKSASRLRIDLGREMATALPDGKKVAGLSKELDRTLEGALENLEKTHYRPEEIRSLLAAIAGTPGRFTTNWDAAAQAYLAVDVLRRSLGDDASNPALRELGELLAFPPGVDGPACFRAAPDFDDRFANLLRQVQAQAERPERNPRR
jgi:hypothetical protein